jgi:NADPH2:quinone reductase
MKAAYITRTGAPDVITHGDLPEPSLASGQCLVEVAAVDVNPIDVYWRAGLVPAPMTFPFILGRDLAGSVIRVGADVTHVNVGDRVWATNMGFGDRMGTFAERVAVPAAWLYPIPESVRDEEVVALSLTGVTAHLGLLRHAQLSAGETLFVNGGTGGVGACVVQMGKILGATVIATAGSEAKVRRCRELGADHVINYQTEDVAARVREWVPDGVDVWWETVREPDFEQTIPLLALRGRMILMAGREATPAFPVGPLYVKDCSVRGFAMFNASSSEVQTAAGAINQWMAEGRLRAQIDRVLPLSEVVEAHRLQEASTLHRSGELAGKIVLTL